VLPERLYHVWNNSSVGWVASFYNPTFHPALQYGKLCADIKPNKSVKGTRRPLAVLKFGFYQGSVASLCFR